MARDYICSRNHIHLCNRKLKNLFAKFGIPELVVSDNGPQFGSAIFKQFGQEYGFQHHKSDPYFPQENGCTERAVQTAKRILAQDDVFMSLMTYKATPLDTTRYSSAQLLMGRQIRTRLPMIKSKLLPKWPALEKVAEADAKMKIASTAGYNKCHGARELSPIGRGIHVLIKGINNKWEENTAILELRVGDRSYLIRNLKHLKALPVQIMNKSTTREEPSINRTETCSRKVCNTNGSATSEDGPYQGLSEEYGKSLSTPIRSTVTKSGRISKPPTQLDL